LSAHNSLTALLTGTHPTNGGLCYGGFVELRKSDGYMRLVMRRGEARPSCLGAEGGVLGQPRADELLCRPRLPPGRQGLTPSPVHSLSSTSAFVESIPAHFISSTSAFVES